MPVPGGLGGRGPVGVGLGADGTGRAGGAPARRVARRARDPLLPRRVRYVSDEALALARGASPPRAELP
jgi:hypothetical protein